jgi:hypothetical protein
MSKWYGTGKAGEGYEGVDSACAEAQAVDPKATCLKCPLAVTYCMACDEEVPRVRLVATGTIPNPFAQ